MKSRMKARTVKGKIKQLVGHYGGSLIGHQSVADELGIVLGYTYQMEKGKRPGGYLYRDICSLHDKIFPKRVVAKGTDADN